MLKEKKNLSKHVRQMGCVCSFCAWTWISQRDLGWACLLCQLFFQVPDLFGISSGTVFLFSWQSTCELGWKRRSGMGGVDSVFNMTSVCCNASSELLGPHILERGVWLIYESYSGQAI